MKIKKYFKPIVLFGILLMSVGCTESSSEKMGSKEHIRAVFQEEFNGPDKELKKILNMKGDDTEGFVKKFNDYVVENSKSHYGDWEHLSSRVYNYIEHAHARGYGLEVEDMKIEESEKTKNSFNFTVKVKRVKSGSKDSETMVVRGLINTNGEGKVIRIKYHNSSKLMAAF